MTILELELFHWNILENKTTEAIEAFILFIDKITKLIEQYAPLKLIKIMSKQIIENPWKTKGLLISSKNYINHRNIYKNLKCLTNKQYF